MATPRPIRAMDPYAQAFWAYTQTKEFRLQQCSECHKCRWPPGPSCDHCLSDQCEWALMKGRGTVLSWTTFHRAYFPEYPAPHTAIVLELDEGPLISSTIIGARQPKDVYDVGQRVEVVYEDHPAEGFTLPRFRVVD